MKTWQILWADGQKTSMLAAEVRIIDGALVFFGEDGGILWAIAAPRWRECFIPKKV